MRSLLALMLAIHFCIGQGVALVWHLKNSGRKQTEPGFDGFVQDVGDYFINLIGRIVAWPYYMHRWLHRSGDGAQQERET